MTGASFVRIAKGSGLDSSLETTSSTFESYADKIFAASTKDDIKERAEIALNLVNTAISLNPKRPWQFYNKGKYLSALGEKSMALDAFNREIAFNEQNPSESSLVILARSYFKKGNLHFELGEHKKALEAYQTVNERYSDQEEIYDYASGGSQAVLASCQMNAKSLITRAEKQQRHQEITGSSVERIDDLAEKTAESPTIEAPNIVRNIQDKISANPSITISTLALITAILILVQKERQAQGQQERERQDQERRQRQELQQRRLQQEQQWQDPINIYRPKEEAEGLVKWYANTVTTIELPEDLNLEAPLNAEKIKEIFEMAFSTPPEQITELLTILNLPETDLELFRSILAMAQQNRATRIFRDADGNIIKIQNFVLEQVLKNNVIPTNPDQIDRKIIGEYIKIFNEQVISKIIEAYEARDKAQVSETLNAVLDRIVEIAEGETKEAAGDYSTKAEEPRVDFQPRETRSISDPAETKTPYISFS